MRRIVIYMTSLILFSCAEEEVIQDPNYEGPKFKAVKNILTSSAKCGKCHVGSSAAGGYDWSVSKNIVNNANRINVAVSLGLMPPPPDSGGFIMSLADKSTIAKWIEVGGDLDD